MHYKNPKKLILIRHGESLLNVARAHSPIHFKTEADRAKFRGIPDHKVDLSPFGEKQARETGIGLSSIEPVDYLYDSGYTRTVRTLNLIKERVPLAQNVLLAHAPLIREREGGYTYFMAKPQVDETFPWLEEYWNTVGPVFARPIGGESVADVIKRIQIFLWQMSHDTHDKTVLIVLHGRVLAAMRFLLEGWSYEELEEFMRNDSPKNCGVTTYERSENDPRKLILKEYNVCYWK